MNQVSVWSLLGTKLTMLLLLKIQVRQTIKGNFFQHKEMVRNEFTQNAYSIIMICY